ncbi:alpha/beta fold hydrolase [Nitrococcus mobilis]|uniref:alpha/beta fold hydrolase n=1 Tax=Nitrococcus mobilis TaxID=35797 RepID=UPI0002FF8B65|nr:alpha/beta hydrolase [Nitrococcus mobilis]
MSVEGRLDPRIRDLNIRGLRYRIYEWGRRSGQPVLLLHGWMDTGTTFRLLAHALGAECHCLAPDWRGFGRSDRAPGGYWFADYLADLEALLDELAPDQAVTLVGHSMGGNVAGLYAGVRPQRVRRLVSIEGFGLAASDPREAPERYARWLESLRWPPRPRRFNDYAALAEHLLRRQPGLTRERAEALAHDWAYRSVDGVYLRGDSAHKRPNPVLYRLEEAMACWRRITAPVLWVYGANSAYVARLRALGDWAERTGCFRDFREASIPEAGHAVHYEQPQALARLIGPFLSAP